MRDFFDGFFECVLVPIVGTLLGSFVLFGAIKGVDRQIEHHYSVSNCHAFGAASGYEVKFVDFNFWDYGCMAQLRNGHWVRVEDLHGVNQ